MHWVEAGSTKGEDQLRCLYSKCGGRWSWTEWEVRNIDYPSLSWSIVINDSSEPSRLLRPHLFMDTRAQVRHCAWAVKLR